MSDSWRDELQAEQGNMSKQEVVEMLKQQGATIVADIDNFKPQEHRWVDRGVIISCEGAGHPYHQTSKR